MKLWVDDVRPSPDGWHWAKSFEDAIAALCIHVVTEVSLDHDLGMVVTNESANGIVTAVETEAKTGCDVACWIETAVYLGHISAPIMRCHSANPVGRKRIEQVIAAIARMDK